MRIAFAVMPLALAACQPAEERGAGTREELGQDNSDIPFTPAPVGPPRTYEAYSKTAMSFTPGVLTVTPTPQKSENLPSGAVFAFGNGIIYETTLNPGGAMMGQNPPDWSKIFVDPNAPIDPEQVTLYDVDAETIPAGTPNGGFCAKTSFIATYIVRSPGAEDLTIAAFQGDQWPPANSDAALCGTFAYANVH